MIKSITRFITLAALFLIPIFPLIVANSFFFPFITGKAFYFRILVEIAFASWIILAFLDASFRPRLNAITICVTVFTFVALLADLLGVNTLRSLTSNFERMEGWITIAHLWMFYIVAASVFDTSNAEGGRLWWHRWMNTFLAVGVIVGIYGFAQLFGQAQIHQGSARIDASLGNAAYMAVYMLMNAGMAAYLFFVSREKKNVIAQWIYGILFVVFSFLLFETATRGTILGLIGGIMLSLLIYSIFAEKKYKRSRIVSASIIGLLILIGVVFWFNRNQAFIQNSEVLRRLASISWHETQTQARSYIWPMAITGFTQRPILGWGQENFNYIFNANYNPKMWTQEQWFDRAHSVFLDWLVASGLVGFLAYLSLYVISLVIIWKSHITVAEKSVLTGLIAGYAVHNVFVFDNLASYVAFFALLSFVGSALSHYEIAGTKKNRKLHSAGLVIGGNKTFSEEIVEYVVAPISILLLLAGLYFLNIRAVSANTSLITALQGCNTSNPDPALFEKVFATGVSMADQEAREQLLSCATAVIQSSQIPGPTKEAFFALANKAIKDQISDAPKDARGYVLGGSFLNSIGQNGEAQSFLEKAHALTPGKQNVSFALANNYLSSNKKDEAFQLLKKAYEDDPTFPEAKSAYAVALIITGKEAEARTIFKDDPTIFESEQIAQVYATLKQYQKAIAIYEKLVLAKPSDVNVRARLAQLQYLAGMKNQAIATLRKIGTDYPEYKVQVDETIKQIQAE
jgi:O-antigen ligase/tetratricopeptide (TPR) repeat protein